MSNESDFTFDDEEIVDFNPLESFDFKEEEETDDGTVVPGVLDDGPYSMPNPENAPKFPLVSFANGKTPEERIDALFDQMPTLQKMLFDIIEMCQEPIPSDELEIRVDIMKEHHHSVYSPMTFCSLLERAGAIIKTNEDGESLEEFIQEPNKVTIDGEEYWEVVPAPTIYWYQTEAGHQKFLTYQPLERLRKVYEDYAMYKDIFTTVLELTALPGGRTMKQIGDIVDDEPICQKPRRYAMYFIDKLEVAGGVEWLDTWVITEPGKQFLEELAKEAADAEANANEEE